MNGQSLHNGHLAECAVTAGVADLAASATAAVIADSAATSVAVVAVVAVAMTVVDAHYPLLHLTLYKPKGEEPATLRC